MNYLIRLFLYICIALIPISCGIRKVNNYKQTDKDKDQTEQSSKGSVSNSDLTGSTEKESNQTDKTDEKQEQRITELFNENGSLKSRITELLNSKSTDKSVNTKEVVKWRYLNTDSVFNNRYYHDRTITKTIKQKNTESSRNGVYWMLLGLGVVGLVLWFKPWAK